MVEWVKDVDSGELFPVYNVRELDIPEHLKEVEAVEVDYDKTRENTILQLQEELTEAQERIKLMKATPISKESCEDIVIAQKTYITSEDVNIEKIPKKHYISDIFQVVINVLLVLLLIAVMIVLFNNFSSVETAEQVAEVAEEIEIVEFQDRLRYILGKVLPVAITIVGIRFSIKILHAMISGC